MRGFCGWLFGLTVLASLPVSAQSPRQTADAGLDRAPAVRLNRPKILPGTNAEAFGTIKGNALTSTNSSMTHTAVRLRDARLGHIAGTQITDDAGLFAFPAIDPGSYVIEILGPDQATVLAASQVLNVSAGEVISAVVKLPFAVPPFARVFGNSPSTALVVATQAAASGVLATQVSGAPTCIPLQ